MHIEFLNNIKVPGPYSAMALLKVLNMGPQLNAGPNQHGWTSHLILGRLLFLMDLYWSQQSRPYGPICPPGNPFRIGPRGAKTALGDIKCPHSMQGMGCKNEKMAQIKIFKRKCHDVARTKMNQDSFKFPQKVIWGPNLQ
ncbi:hypothetical protein O181_034715 [Austropuccinia psidii MF-1]|uniref:Uncharacterized protein n=1 Tax=Austropuccinia psidii MF-1 TaxID=1389203 RepID=A0A9Q3D3H9_9BASI|nr:hypothetical protein [Austropuccinia psidii MF-1]